MKPGSVAKRDSEYERAGTANVFCGVEPKAGVHFTKVTPNRSSPEFADFIQSIADWYPKAATIHLVMDNLSSHTSKALRDRFGEQAGGAHWDRFTVHYTPLHGSWLNQAELEIACFQSNAWASAGSERSGFCEPKLAPGTAESIENEPRSTGSSIASKPERSSSTSTTASGQRPRRYSLDISAILG
jgi:hypothetical protein